jgi:hypothetical protein
MNTIKIVIEHRILSETSYREAETTRKKLHHPTGALI